eukprot:gene40993-50003_t
MIACQRDIDLCQFHEWYDLFKHVSIKSKVIPLPEEFFQYLSEDGVFLPLPSHLDHDHLSDEDDADVQETKSTSSEPNVKYRFPEVEAAIADALEQFGRSVFVKTNWSAPLDAAWMNAGSMKCVTVNEVFLLIKSSDRVLFDVEKMYDLVHEPTKRRPDVLHLVIRKWANLHPSMEFRAFVYNRELVGVCQRNCHTFFPFLPAEADAYARQISDFFHNEIREKSLLDSFVMDLYIDQKQRLWLLDVNPFGEPTCSLLFDWAELLQHADAPSSSPLVRAVESAAEVLQSTAGSHRGPVD